MSRPALRLVEPLTDAMEFPEGKSHSAGLREIIHTDEVHSHLQLYLMWPDYSSSFIKVAGEMVKATISVDQALGEFDQLFISTDADTFLKIKSKNQHLQRVFIEVFGITFGFEPIIQECIEEYSEETPCLSIQIPIKITRYNMRGTRRVRIDEPPPLIVNYNGERLQGILQDVSPSSFCIKLSHDLQIKNAHVSIEHAGLIFDAIASKSLKNSIVIKPITSHEKHFGHYFDLYVKFAYPMLRSRFSFAKDPIPELMHLTGQAKKFAEREASNSWLDRISEAYNAAKDALNTFIADYVATNDEGTPIATSSLAKAFIDIDETPIWAFHGVGSIQDPNFLEHTCAIYNWRSDYLLAKDPSAKVIVWFDGRGRWIEKVYTKFQRLTSDNTKLWAIRNNRYIKCNSEIKQSLNKYPLPTQKAFSKGAFKRFVAANKNISFGMGVPYLNYSGVLENLFFKEKDFSEATIDEISGVIDETRPERFFIPTPTELSDLNFDGFEMFCLESTTRQCLTNGDALKFFSSSLEHSKAVVRKKYGR